MVSQLFQEKAEAVNNLSTTPSNDELLELYGLYKQATVGDNNKERPGMFNLKDKYKWDAWEKLKGMTQEEAEQKYIEYVDQLQAKYA
ncbi:LAFE_0B08130g1_1 [Lachancea fermentati]|uniref:LAFE_0B08130g1_1 n=1 Tax=Lachancea fermentati TaxID=4955 RepID=A0A1G4M872_LACFM|nr:LAFE_0B08130g1_1 [Lachancea fermentati]